ncbi:MAG: hypothetical protein KA010_01430 [Saprospiraceae bacterium]|nr:hypothetical protein [Saprospiraceae bacterium]
MNKAEAQLNTRVAFQGSYSELNQLNTILERYNAQTSGLNVQVKPLHLLTSVQLGLRYSFEHLRVETMFHLQINNRTGTGIVPGSTTEFKRKLYFRGNSYSFGLDADIFKHFSVGANAMFNQFKINSYKTGRTDKFTVVNENYWSSQIFATYNVENSDIMSIGIRPYIEIPWKNVQLNDLDLELNPISADANANISERIVQYGIMFIFCNGRQ